MSDFQSEDMSSTLIRCFWHSVRVVYGAPLLREWWEKSCPIVRINPVSVIFKPRRKAFAASIRIRSGKKLVAWAIKSCNVNTWMAESGWLRWSWKPHIQKWVLGFKSLSMCRLRIESNTCKCSQWWCWVQITE